MYDRAQYCCWFHLEVYKMEQQNPDPCKEILLDAMGETTDLLQGKEILICDTCFFCFDKRRHSKKAILHQTLNT